ncbi:MAG: hypothetical protein N2572_06465 [Syntrophales bacterium]|nr:hypothetical protein [Syntrophales bacterium]
MMFLTVPLALFLLVVIQNLLADILFLGRSPLELSLLVVIYLAFRMNLVRGGIISSFLGFLMDCLSGTVTGIYIFIYFTVFSATHYIAHHLYGEGDWFIIFLVFFWGVVESFFLLLFKSLPTGVFCLSKWGELLFPQIIPLCVLGPFVFRALDGLGFIYGVNERSSERT